MNFVDPKEYDIPGLVRKNRYKTILPSEYSLPLTWVPLNPEGDFNFSMGLQGHQEARQRDGRWGCPMKGNTPFREQRALGSFLRHSPDLCPGQALCWTLWKPREKEEQ